MLQFTSLDRLHDVVRQQALEYLVVRISDQPVSAAVLPRSEKGGDGRDIWVVHGLMEECVQLAENLEQANQLLDRYGHRSRQWDTIKTEFNDLANGRRPVDHVVGRTVLVFNSKRQSEPAAPAAIVS